MIPYDELRARGLIRTMDEGRALAALMLGGGTSRQLNSRLITAIGNEGARTGDTLGGHARYLLATAYRELLAGEPAAPRSIPRSRGGRAAIAGAVTRIRRDRREFPELPTFYCYAYMYPSWARAGNTDGWAQYVNAAAARLVTQGDPAPCPIPATPPTWGDVPERAAEHFRGYRRAWGPAGAAELAVHLTRMQTDPRHHVTAGNQIYAYFGMAYLRGIGPHRAASWAVKP